LLINDDPISQIRESEHKSGCDLKMSGRPSQSGDRVLRIKIMSFNVQSNSTAHVNLRTASDRISTLQFLACHYRAIACEFGSGKVDAA